MFPSITRSGTLVLIMDVVLVLNQSSARTSIGRLCGDYVGMNKPDTMMVRSGAKMAAADDATSAERLYFKPSMVADNAIRRGGYQSMGEVASQSVLISAWKSSPNSTSKSVELYKRRQGQKHNYWSV
jgi:hypothetical protein